MLTFFPIEKGNFATISKVSFVEERVMVDWKAEILAGVYWGYEIPETQTARVNDVVLPFPTPFPKGWCLNTEKEFVSCYCLFFSPKRPIWNSWFMGWISNNSSMLSAVLNGEEPTQWGTPVTWKSCVQNMGW